ncbi:DUF1223 domain-containing protein [Roseobacter denitrificans]|uniref:DUF1223 domain-containing protein n=1 Tax=Roseobacter denitrificans (strain ATCC 33942 / OCh 114) TaxID=375451 RepID=Q166I0_ROSDO|nr:DUF1223 domain-containing protein [Roseobacter denitrificans]ABG32113.1 conserved hypothetical protein [Roseobacter denitrificans OCh 114]AVL51624.1 DUF1223 domain-containing protein [Roseobacter denitrificans]SFF77478.1 hypothetical protein SAMN05443635_10270 [Roseobacter denitrificans OCh 114]
MKRLLRVVAACWFVASPVLAENTPVVVELFTSQGCSSCPPADEFMQVLAQRDDVIALSVHVDYWDYIGWKDEFADPKHAERQRAYATLGGRRSVYTPEMIVNGVSDILGAKPMAVATAIEAHKSQARAVSVSLSRTGSTVSIEATVLQDDLGPMTVQMVRYQPQRVAKITRGENAGKTIPYVNVAQDWQVVTTWDGFAPLSIDADAPGVHPVVVLIQSGTHGPILAAARAE